MSEINWNDAPKDAERWNGQVWLKMTGNQVYAWFKTVGVSRWNKCKENSAYYNSWDNATPRPVETVEQVSGVESTLTERGERYGEFEDGAKYERELIGLCGTKVKTDVYRVLDAFKTDDPILDHLIKKALCAGTRGHKDKLTDYRNIVESATKALKLLEQKS